MGLDINPYYLHHAPVEARARGGGMRLPGATPPGGSFDLIVANNFLHHVTEVQTPGRVVGHRRERRVQREHGVLGVELGHPHVLAILGLKGAAARASQEIEQVHWQSPRDRAVERDRQGPTTRSRGRLLHERAHLLPVRDLLVSHALHGAADAAPAQTHLSAPAPAGASLDEDPGQTAFDEFQDRSRDACVSYVGRSRAGSGDRVRADTWSARRAGEAWTPRMPARNAGRSMSAAMVCCSCSRARWTISGRTIRSRWRPRSGRSSSESGTGQGDGPSRTACGVAPRSSRS